MTDGPGADEGLPLEPGGGKPILPGSLILPASGREVAQFVARRAAACVGADYSNLALVSASGDSMRVFHGPTLDSEIADRYTDVPLAAPYPLSAAAREGRVVLLPDIESYGEEFAEIVADTIESNLQATASLPLYRADGTLLGALGFAWSEPTTFTFKLEAALRAVAHLCVETVERSERYDAEHELVIELQNRLLGDLPVLEEVEAAARYLPANSVPSVGGDWYEGLLLSDHEIALVVGDVNGHGLGAAADMALIRGMISALLYAGVPASDVFAEVSGVLVQRTTLLLATAALAIIDLSTETITFVTAGHPPPLLRLPDGEVQLLDSANGAMIGVPGTGPHVSGTAAFPPGSQLVLYTDGLVERRDRPFDVGVAEMASHLAGMSSRLDPTDLIDSLLDKLMGDNKATDDIAILIAEHTG